MDVTSEESISAAAKQVSIATGGHLDYLVSNAGQGYSIPLLDSKTAEVEALFKVNVFAFITLVQHFFPLLQESKGTIVSISSIGAVAPFPWQGWYNASKATVSALNDQLRVELSPFDIKVISVIAEDSAASAEIIKIMRGETIPDSIMDVTTFAEKVVSNTVKKNPSLHLWVGTGGTVMWIVHTFGWKTIWDTMFWSYFQINVVNRKIRKSLATKIAQVK